MLESRIQCSHGKIRKRPCESTRANANIQTWLLCQTKFSEHFLKNNSTHFNMFVRKSARNSGAVISVVFVTFVAFAQAFGIGITV